MQIPAIMFIWNKYPLNHKTPTNVSKTRKSYLCMPFLMCFGLPVTGFLFTIVIIYKGRNIKTYGFQCAKWKKIFLL